MEAQGGSVGAGGVGSTQVDPWLCGIDYVL